ncbi:MAG: GrpB family protein [Caldilinea sp.]
MKGLYDRTHHVHAFDAGSPHVRRHTAFRDYLIVHPSVAKDYEALKLKCAAECDNNNDKYCDGKDEFVREHERRAMEWYKCQQPCAADADKPRG